jgi:hypothetical protein
LARPWKTAAILAAFAVRRCDPEESVMGMYDTLRFCDEAASRCAAGHPIRELQTKDLACELQVYFVYGGRLYRPGTGRTFSSRLNDEGRLVLTETRLAEPAALSIDLTAYGECPDCRPVLYLGERGWHGDYVRERRAWCEWRFVFRDGVLAGTDPVRIESRSNVADALRREGLEVLSDDERLAQLHFERLRQGEARADDMEPSRHAGAGG